MTPRPNIDEILKKTVENIVSGRRNPENPINLPYYFLYSSQDLLTFCSKGGILPVFDDIFSDTALTFRINNSVTRFLMRLYENGGIDLSDSSYVMTLSVSHFNSISMDDTEENQLFIKYIEDLYNE